MFVASTEFVEAAAAQSAALGFTPASVFVPHPIQDRTALEMQDLADNALSAIVRALTNKGQ
ncbi:MAG: hypothetical protein DWQ04_07940 [Chloroflexi bacterium]|nr:MAG: hypothetical protein DWQ04_07940 [Chloroflexota bacterium]